MENTESTFDTIMKHCPFLRDLIESKITEEVGKKDTVIVALQEELESAKNRVRDTEDAINMILEVM